MDTVSRSVKAGLQFPVDRIGRYLKKGRYSQGVGTVLRFTLLLFLNTLLLTEEHDEELRKLLAGVTIAHGGVLANINPILLPKKNEKPVAKEPKSPSKATKKSPSFV
ncbi:hypothetical protein Goshw_011244 [Gossypium schwendimanii]|uniref:Histone H2A C-terminal domain-containing protein n=1 Tax=Gossypium schwendimanii TaxID=34291 RepID=A0A7J9KRP9_GOSSC|nr:hypothetical protein [Gossypium schwendimanii]